MSNTFTIGQLSEHVAGGNERAMRNLLNTVEHPRLDPYAIDPLETVTRLRVVDLFASRAGDRVGRKLAELLREAYEPPVVLASSADVCGQ